MPVAIMVVRHMQLRLSANINGLRVELMEIEKESKIIVNKFMSRIKLYASSPMLNSGIIEFKFKV